MCLESGHYMKSSFCAELCNTMYTVISELLLGIPELLPRLVNLAVSRDCKYSFTVAMKCSLSHIIILRGNVVNELKNFLRQSKTYLFN